YTIAIRRYGTSIITKKHSTMKIPFLNRFLFYANQAFQGIRLRISTSAITYINQIDLNLALSVAAVLCFENPIVIKTIEMMLISGCSMIYKRNSEFFITSPIPISFMVL